MLINPWFQKLFNSLLIPKQRSPDACDSCLHSRNSWGVRRVPPFSAAHPQYFSTPALWSLYPLLLFPGPGPQIHLSWVILCPLSQVSRNTNPSTLTEICSAWIWLWTKRIKNTLYDSVIQFSDLFHLQESMASTLQSCPLRPPALKTSMSVWTADYRHSQWPLRAAGAENPERRGF